MAEYSGELTHCETSHDKLDPGYYRIRARMATSRHGTKKHSMSALNACFLFCLSLVGLMAFVYVLFDPVVRHIVLKKLVLRNSSDVAHLWEEPPITPHLKIYFFNLTNPEQVFEGLEKPKLDEVGPYVYHQKWIKENVAWHGNGTMSYSTRKIYTFMPELSEGHHSNDVITTLNIPMLTSFYQMRDANLFTAWGLSTVLYSLDYKPWLNKTVEELVWGYDEPLFELARMTLPNPPTFDKFGLFFDKNTSGPLAKYTMFTGERDPYKLSKISSFNGKAHLDFWKEDKCNLVQGSDGSTFSPYIQQDETLWFFNDQLCRSLPMTYSETVHTKTIEGYRFVPREDVFMSPATYPENECFCTDPDLCDMIGDGMFAISKCQFDAPIILSWPHFMGANRSFLNAVEGMNPREDRHQFYFDVQPVTGTTLAAKARIQINLAVKNSKIFDDISKINDTVIPILWFEEGLDELGDDLMTLISSAVIDPPLYKNYVLCVLLGMITTTTVIGLIALIRLALNRRARRFSDDDIFNVRQTAEKMIPQYHGMSETHMPMLASSSGLDSGLVSSEGSRMTSASHSRNTSAGSASTFNPSEHSGRLEFMLGNEDETQPICSSSSASTSPGKKGKKAKGSGSSTKKKRSCK
eukprot:maker-scaffold92_size382268-snap-gene-1.19 protein:Tk08744 transcript:maker-scaffold92_size382268-snap-gene-1.19-mRNA-1 annotation:"scavenger receptor class b member 1"